MIDAPVIFDIPLACDDGIRKVALDTAGTAHVYSVPRDGADPVDLHALSFSATFARDLAANVLSGAALLPTIANQRILAAAVLLLDRQIEEMAQAERARVIARAEDMAL